jgi:hypothetical protein
MATLEKTCPTTWNPTSGAVIWTMPTVGLRIVVILNPDPRMKQKKDTNTNWIKVKVTGYRNWFMICLPMLLVTAEDKYQSRQSKGSFEALYILRIIPRVEVASTCSPVDVEVDEEEPPSIISGSDILLLDETAA